MDYDKDCEKDCGKDYEVVKVDENGRAHFLCDGCAEDMEVA